MVDIHIIIKSLLNKQMWSCDIMHALDSLAPMLSFVLDTWDKHTSIVNTRLVRAQVYVSLNNVKRISFLCWLYVYKTHLYPRCIFWFKMCYR